MTTFDSLISFISKLPVTDETAEWTKILEQHKAFASFIALVSRLKSKDDLRAYIKQVINPETIEPLSCVYISGTTKDGPSCKALFEKHYVPFYLKGMKVGAKFNIGNVYVTFFLFENFFRMSDLFF